MASALIRLVLIFELLQFGLNLLNHLFRKIAGKMFSAVATNLPETRL
jgi:hypothetical protein